MSAPDALVENGQDVLEEPLPAAVANGVDAAEDRKRGRESVLPEGDAAEALEERPRKRKHHKKDKVSVTSTERRP